MTYFEIDRSNYEESGDSGGGGCRRLSDTEGRLGCPGFGGGGGGGGSLIGNAATRINRGCTAMATEALLK